jgi:hypothetical protein
MSHEHSHSNHEHHHNETPRKRPIHHDWRFWVAVLLMLTAMGVYVTRNGFVGPGGKSQPVPEATP